MYRTPTIIMAVLFCLLGSGCSEPSSSLPYPLEVDEEGVGRIDAQTPFDASRIGQLMPGFEVTVYTAFEGGRPHSLIRVSRGRSTVITLSPDAEAERIGAAEIRHPEVTAPGGVTLGTGFTVLLDGTDSCTRQPIGSRTELVCPAPNSRRISYLFASDTPAVEPERLFLTGILWRPDA